MPASPRPPLATLAVAVAAAALGYGCESRVAWNGPVGESRRVVVEAFRADSSRRVPQGRAVAESLAQRLGAVKGLDVRFDEGGSGDADFMVRGEVTARDGRFVVLTQLHLSGRDDVLWSATFWRRDSIDSSLVADLATGLAEAIYAQLAREAVSAKEGKH